MNIPLLLALAASMTFVVSAAAEEKEGAAPQSIESVEIEDGGFRFTVETTEAPDLAATCSSLCQERMVSFAGPNGAFGVPARGNRVVLRDVHPGNFILAAPDVHIPIDVGIEEIEYEFIS